MTFADLRAVGFFRKLGFRIPSEGGNFEKKELLGVIEHCKRSQLMICAAQEWSLFNEIDQIKRKVTNI